ncbi:MAG: hypothetical protein J7K40_01185 [candidate division Zixibacteria bacterium]|nr:hypothetical protein [candidate division Zixibacteria bacterium]
MKKLMLAAILLLAITMPASGQEFWNLRISVHGSYSEPGDAYSRPAGIGARFLLGKPGGNFDMGFEVEKWFRTYDRYDATMDSLDGIPDGIPSGKTTAENKQSGLGFSAMFRYQFLNLSSNNLYTGAGGGFYFIQSKREEARANDQTGLWEVVYVDNYLETKGHVFGIAGIERNLSGQFDIFLEGKFTYVFDAYIKKNEEINGDTQEIKVDIWDDPYMISGLLGIRYNF